LINAALQEPQRIYNRDRLVAVVIEAKVFEELLFWQQNRAKLSLADAFTELRQSAATAQIQQLTLVTRNIRDFDSWGIPLLNPFTIAF
jgi:predicted nucleic acid-binding protein